MTEPSRDPIVEGGRRVEAVLISAPACHLCHDAAALLATMSGSYPLRVVELDCNSPEGRSVVNRLRTPFLPVLLIDGEYFGHGRISPRKLERHLASLFSDAAVSPIREM
ncbi:MAG: hypothetical protein WEE36_04725 [Acidimicrobiia bacterium]